MRTDPISDLLTRIRNGSRSRHARIEVPLSRLKTSVVEVLKQEGFVDDYREIAGPTPGQGVLEIKLRYDERKEPVITGIKRISSPGLRNYMGYNDIPKIQSGLGVLILTTPKGVMSDRQAKKQKVGGEALCAVW